ncbi:hypothetical protein AB0H34_34280 [Saccharopolyspora shandongensis]|uniref:hypothetical protein n=1 Tax=Saccharopolyspora shandongensis TaxID=418495 RepID=UPI00340034C0
MSGSVITGAAGSNNGPQEARDKDKCSWTLPCTNAFGRSYELVITARRGGPSPGIGISSPAGEYAFMEVDRAGDLVWAINRATAFLDRPGRW